MVWELIYKYILVHTFLNMVFQGMYLNCPIWNATPAFASPQNSRFPAASTSISKLKFWLPLNTGSAGTFAGPVIGTGLWLAPGRPAMTATVANNIVQRRSVIACSATRTVLTCKIICPALYRHLKQYKLLYTTDNSVWPVIQKKDSGTCATLAPIV